MKNQNKSNHFHFEKVELWTLLTDQDFSLLLLIFIWLKKTSLYGIDKVCVSSAIVQVKLLPWAETPAIYSRNLTPHLLHDISYIKLCVMHYIRMHLLICYMTSSLIYDISQNVIYCMRREFECKWLWNLCKFWWKC